MTTVLTTFLLMRGVNAVEPMSVFALNLIIGLGLGLAIDYSLFVVSRFREELERRDRGPPMRSRPRCSRRGGRCCSASATVAAALAALLVFPQRFLFSMGVGGILVTLVAATVSLTVLPALLAALGPRVNAISSARWRAAMHREAARAESGLLVPAVALGHAPAGRDRGDDRDAADRARAAVHAGQVHGRGRERARVVALGAGRRRGAAHASSRRTGRRRSSSPRRRPRRRRAEVRGVRRRLGEIPGVLAVQEPVAAGGLWRIGVVAPGARLDQSAKDAVKAVRAVDAPFPVQVGGSTAEFLDQQSALAERIPVALVILATTTLVILFLMTGSVVLPVKALIMNLLTLSAAFGILTLIFQDGRLEGLLGYTSQGALESSQPILLFAIAFGLSTDYGVFLLTRIKEARDSGLPNDEAVAVGLQRTGRIVTAAAILFCIAIGAFVDLGDDLHQAARPRDGARGADRRDDRPRAARAVADEAAGRVELVGAAAAGAAARADRARGERPA